MNVRYLNYFLARVFALFAFVLLIPLFFSFFVYSSEHQSLVFVKTIAICIVMMILVALFSEPINIDKFSFRDAVAIIVITWFVIGIISAIPFLYSLKYFGSITNAFFESFSGLTTTGSSILADIESVPKSILLWRSFTHFIGGGGIVIFTVIIIQNWGTTGMALYGLESTRPMGEKNMDRIRSSAQKVIITYITLNILCILLLKIGHMSWLEAFSHSFAALATGGFSPLNSSIATYTLKENSYAFYFELVLILFMFLGATPFLVHYQAIYKKKWSSYFRDSQIRFYLLYILISITLVAFNLYYYGKYSSIYTCFRHSAFSVVSMFSTTGFGTEEFAFWPLMSRYILIIGMFIGGCLGSTAGGLKIFRIQVLIKHLFRSIEQLVYPKRIVPTRVGKNILTLEELKSLLTFILLFLSTFVIGFLALSFFENDFEGVASAVITAMSGVGPGTVSQIGALGNFSQWHTESKWIMIFLMLLGRLEIYPIAAFFMRSFWD